MKQKFSKSWISSSKRRKQKKYRHNAPLHLRHKMVAANLSKDLRAKYKRRSFPLRKNDVVKIMRGKFRGKTGKITEVDLRTMRVTIEGIQIQKKDGTKVNVFQQPSNLQIQEFDLNDKERVKSLEKKIKIETKEKKDAS